MDATRFDRLTRALASRRGLLVGTAATLAGLLGALALGEVHPGTAQSKPKPKRKCRAPGRACSAQFDCCSRTCLRADGPNGRPQGRKRCLCAKTLQLPCGGRCCSRHQTCKNGRCVHHCRDGKTNVDESDRDCGGEDCPKCEILNFCNVPSDCTSGHCALIPSLDAKTHCVECTADVHCGNATKPFCDTFGGGPGAGGACVQCRDELDCQEGELCEGSTCVPGFCTTNADCASADPGKTTCCDGLCGKPCGSDGDCVCPSHNGPHTCIEGVCVDVS